MNMPTNATIPIKPLQKFVSGTSRNFTDARTLMQRLRDLEAQVAEFLDPERKLEIGARLKRARENSGLGQQAIADGVHVKLRTYQFWEEGTKGVNRGNINRAAKVIGVDADAIWFGDEESDQLDRIEDKLDAILQTLATDRQKTVDELLAELGAVAAQRARKTAGSPAKGRGAQGGSRRKPPGRP